MAATELTALYLHIPFCASLCHYCDFAKTANYHDELVDRYFQRLHEHLALWCAHLPCETRFASVYLGGGTPSLFSTQFAPLFAVCAERLAPDCEITLEVNPQDVTREKLQQWKTMGINRLSLGLQTFNAQHLHFLRRTHTVAQGRDAVLLAAEFFADNLSVDLIYGFPQQRMQELEADLAAVLALPLMHLSLYNLTYESGTPIGRARQRGKLTPLAVDVETQMYDFLCTELAVQGFEHYEISNWAQANMRSRHNSTYWCDAGYLGIGTGAHGYLPEAGGAGLRYSYARNERTFSEQALPSASQTIALEQLPVLLDTISIDSRDRDAWLLEYLASSLRTVYGVDLRRITAKSGKTFTPTSMIASASRDGLLKRHNDVLYLHQDEWWRENFWLQQLLPVFV